VDPHQIRLKHPRLIFLVAAFTAIAPLCTDLYLPVMPSMSASLGTSASAVQATITTVLLGLALGQLVAGPLSDQLGRRGPLIFGSIAFIVTNVASAFAPNIGVLLFVRFLVGLSAAICVVVSRAIVADVYPGIEGARAFALLGSVMGIAPAVAPVLGGFLATIMDWRGMFVVLALFGLLLSFLAVVRIPESMPEHARQESGFSSAASDLSSCLANRRFMTFVACSAMSGGILFSYIASSSFVLEDGFGLGTTAYGFVFAANSVGIFCVALIGRRLVGRLGPVRLLWTGQSTALLGSAIALTALVAHLLPLLLIGLFIAIASLGLIMANSMALGMGASPVRAGAASALLGISGFLVGGLLAPLAGLSASGVALGLMMLGFSLGGLLLHRVLLPR
jgi:DHA1 family bicyclomycin/chloramphenicol resistance-like MFS transporter